MKNVVFLGYITSKTDEEVLSGISIAGNKMQRNLLTNLAHYKDIKLHCITVTPLATYPNDKRMFQRREKVYVNDSLMTTKVFFINIAIIKQISQILSVYFEALTIILRYPNSVIFCYNLFPQIGIPMRWLKFMFRRVTTLTLLADLPLDDNNQRRGIAKCLRKIFDLSTINNLKYCDKFIILNVNVANKFNLAHKPYIVMEGGVEDDQVLQEYQICKLQKKKRNIIFSGALSYYNGITRLIDAMSKVQFDDIIVDIYGSGYLEDIVIDAAKRNSNIKFHGRFSNDFIIERQREAWLLINPRIVNDPISLYTFPSKIHEYMLSGTPILSSDLNGLNDDYKSMMFIIKEDTADSIADAINLIALLPQSDLELKSRQAYEFVTKEKNWSKQTKRVYEFVTREV